MGSERPGIEMQIVCRVVSVDVRVFENIGLRAKYAEMSDGVDYYAKVLATKCLS